MEGMPTSVFYGTGSENYAELLERIELEVAESKQVRAGNKK